MTEPPPIDQARDAVQQLLDALGIARVVFVDDSYSEGPGVEAVVAAAWTLPSEELPALIPELAETGLDDPDVVRDRIRAIWDARDSAGRERMANQVLAVARRLRPEDTDDAGDAAILGDLIPEDKLVPLSPTGWEKRRGDFLQENAQQPALFLFDQDLSHDGGDAQGGIKIIASLLATDDTGKLICGLLTHTVTPEEQPDAWDELSRTYDIPRDRFLVIPKQHISQDPVFFAHRLKMVALSPDFTVLKDKTKLILQNATAAAADRVEKISIYDLDHIVFRISAEEGLWEPDMLFRLHALFHRLESRRLAHQGGELEGIASRLRTVSHIPADAEFRPPSTTWKIQHEELYEPPEYLNANHLPLELGDVFTKTDGQSQKHYILLAQPCDLMIRANGKRQPELAHIPSAEVVPVESPPNYAEELPYFSDSSSDTWYVKLKLVHQVCACVLDLCMFNDDGCARIKLDGSAPETMRPALKARYDYLQTMLNRMLRRLEGLVPGDDNHARHNRTMQDIFARVSGILPDDGLFKGTLEHAHGNTVITYNCRRVCRLCRERAFGLLMAYTGCLSRPAFDRDFR